MPYMKFAPLTEKADIYRKLGAGCQKFLLFALHSWRTTILRNEFLVQNELAQKWPIKRPIR
jgi:hypothetical protein